MSFYLFFLTLFYCVIAFGFYKDAVEGHGIPRRIAAICAWAWPLILFMVCSIDLAEFLFRKQSPKK